MHQQQEVIGSERIKVSRVFCTSLSNINTSFIIFFLIPLSVIIFFFVTLTSTFCSNSWSGSSGFEPPIERANYLAAKEKLDPSKPADLEELRKLLMRRAIKAIPIVLSLQNEGNSIERLYKRGMLTDDMHFKVKDLKAFVDQEFQDVQYEADDLLEVMFRSRIYP